MNINKLDQKILKHSNKLTDNEMDLLRYIHKNANDVSKDTISQVAKSTHYSSSFVSKTIKKIGYTSFAEMKYELKQNLEEEQHESTNNLFLQQQKDINKTYNLLTQLDFSHINQLFDRASAIYVYGTGHSQMNYMKELSRNLMALVKVPVIFLSGQSEFQSVLYTAKSTACFIIASTTGESEFLLDGVKILNLGDVPIISITKFSDNTLSQLATYNLFYYSTFIKNPIGSRNIKSFLPLAYTVDFVIREYIDHLKNKIQKEL